MFDLRVATPLSWVDHALVDFDAFLIDHASCERKASAVGLSFIVRYPDRTALIDPMISFAREELEHFHQVYRLIAGRGLSLGPDESDPYVNLLMEHVRHGREERFLDRLLVSSIIEARGHERLKLIAERLNDPELQAFYHRLAKSEGSHRDLFVRLAELYYPIALIRPRLTFLLETEAQIIANLPARCALH